MVWKRRARRRGIAWRWLRLLPHVLMLLLVLAAPVVGDEPTPSRVEVLAVEGAITPVVVGYIERGIAEAEASGAQALIIQLDTPGGSVEVTRRLTRRMTEAEIPIVVYIAPSGAYAASAGTFVTLAAHVAAMAPGTSIGAASPVSSGGEELGETALEKAMSILEADVKGLAKRRGDAAVEWAVAAVREAKASTEDEALSLGIVDIIAVDFDDLLAQLDGREVEVRGQTITLHTADAGRNPIAMTEVERFFHVITDPNIAFILMTLGLNGLLFELSSPGGYVAGIIGGICLLLGLYALGVLEANWIGLVFIILGFGLFVADIKVATGGVLTVAGVVSFVVGSLLLFQTSAYAVSRSLVFGVAAATGAFFAFAVAKAVGAQRRQPTTGLEGMMGRSAVARTELAPRGSVFLMGEWWEAEAEGEPIGQGETVEVVGHEGFLLRVRRRAE
ncbi:MAG: nodulation protein NfeD [Chloroflexi bacterium]|nr:nodulation protein NfeD [Chloroflexota bacterium]